MRLGAVGFLFALGASACSHSHRLSRSPQALETNCAPGPILEGRVAGLSIGATVATVRERCNVIADTMLSLGTAALDRELVIEVGSDRMLAMIDSNRVSGIMVVSPHFRTVDSLGVGTQLATLLRHHAWAVPIDGRYFALLQDHCGVLFMLPALAPPHPGNLDDRALHLLPDTLAVERVTVGACDSSWSAT